MELYDELGERQQRMPTLLTGTDHVADKREFRHFMLKEIHEQPETAELWVARHLPQGLTEQMPVALPLEASFYEGIERIEILACGTSRHAAMVGAYLLEQFAGVPTAVYYASEFRYSPPPLAANTLTIGVTQSGGNRRHLGGSRHGGQAPRSPWRSGLCPSPVGNYQPGRELSFPSGAPHSRHRGRH